MRKIIQILFILVSFKCLMFGLDIENNTKILQKSDSDSSMVVFKSGDFLYLRTKFDETRDLVQWLEAFAPASFMENPIYDENGPLEFEETYLIPKINENYLPALLNNNIEIVDAGDNATPYNYDPLTMNYVNNSEGVINFV